MSQSTPAVRPRFTLIELLVVIAIISVLAAILLPALSNARTAAELAVCSSNQKQLFLATYLYADESDGDLPYPGTSSNKTQQLFTRQPIGIGLLYAGRYLGGAELAYCPGNTYTPALLPGTRSRLDYLYTNGEHNGGNSWTYITYVSRAVSQYDVMNYHAPYAPNARRLSTNVDNGAFRKHGLPTSPGGTTMKSPRALYMCAIPLSHPIWQAHGGLASHRRQAINATYADGAVLKIRTNPAKPFLLGLGNNIDPQFLGVDMQHPDYRKFYRSPSPDLYKSNAKQPN